jgi:hypothetical protein
VLVAGVPGDPREESASLVRELTPARGRGVTPAAPALLIGDHPRVEIGWPYLTSWKGMRVEEGKGEGQRLGRTRE